MKKLRAAIVGSGMIAQARHIPAFKRMKNRVDLVAICDKNLELAAKTAHQFGISSAYSEIDSMLAKESVELLDVCVPPQIHAPVAITGIERGCNIIMEKPMALKTSDCDDMIVASKRNNTDICVIHNNLFHPPFTEALDRISRGDIGDVVGMRIFLSTPRWDMVDLENHWYHKLPGGVLGETGPHLAYMSQAVIGDVKDLEIHARNRLGHSWASHDEFAIHFDGERGFCEATLSYSRETWAAIVDIFGVESGLCLDLNQMSILRHKLTALAYPSITRLALSQIGGSVKNLAANGVAAMTMKKTLGTEVVIEKFAYSLMGCGSNPVTGEDGRRAVELMERLVKRYDEKYGR